MKRARSRSETRGSASRAGTPIPPLAAHDPFRWAVMLLALVCAAVAVTFRMSTPDVWQHVLVGKALWQLGRVPQEHLWTWPLYGTSDVLPSWGFRALLWPFWKFGEVWGLQVWRWATTLGALGLGVATARRLGARGLTPWFVVAIAALTYRTRGQVRPETLVAVLLALQIWVLERRRAQGGGALLLVVIAWAWANVHISYYLGLALLTIHLLARPKHHGVSAQDRGSLLARIDQMPTIAVLAAAVAISFVNPFGWRALWQPFEYALVWRNEPIYQPIPELAPLWRTWPSHLRSGLPFLVALWPLLALGRWFARRFDPIEALTCLLFTAHALFNQRFTGALAIAAVPYLSRDLSELARAIRWPASWVRPRVRAVGVALAMILVSLGGWTDRRYPLGVGFVATCYPGAACDFIAREGLRGRMFNPYYFGGYVLWRFWPEKERLPFIDIHQSGSRRDRDLYAYAFANDEAWSELMRTHQFDLALLDGHQEWTLGDRLLDRLDADSSWALVFRDDAAAVFVRRDVTMATAAERLGYRVMPGGIEKFTSLAGAARRDTTLRVGLRGELERCAASSPLNAWANTYLASLDFLDHDAAAARWHLNAALAVDPRTFGAHRRLGYLDLMAGSWRSAIAEFEAELALGGPLEDERQRIGEAWEKLGDRRRAAAAYRRELDEHPMNEAARAGLQRLGG